MTKERASERMAKSLWASKGRNVCRDVYRKLARKPFTRIKSNRSNLVDKREEGCACRTINRFTVLRPCFNNRYCCRKNSVQPSFPLHHPSNTISSPFPISSPISYPIAPRSSLPPPLHPLPLKSDIGLQAMNRLTARIIGVRISSNAKTSNFIYLSRGNDWWFEEIERSKTVRESKSLVTVRRMLQWAI